MNKIILVEILFEMKPLKIRHSSVYAEKIGERKLPWIFLDKNVKFLLFELVNLKKKSILSYPSATGNLNPEPDSIRTLYI